MHALMALPPFSWIGEADEGIDDDGPMLRETSSLPLPLANIVKTRTADRMRPDYSRTADKSYWMNHCEYCGAKQGDFFVHGANGPFWPNNESEMKAIEAVHFDGPFTLQDPSTAYSGAMADWRDHLHGVVRPVIPSRKRRKKVGPSGTPGMETTS